MTEMFHINCGTLVVPSYPTVVCHCLALRDAETVVLIDTGIGLADVRDPEGRLGRELIDAAGFRFNEHDTAVRRLEAMGVRADHVSDVVLTHADPDHAGGLADFPEARVHISKEELESVESGHWRYVSAQFGHGPTWNVSAEAEMRDEWFGLPACRVDVPISSEVLFVALPGHTRAHRGVAVSRGDRWFLHVGDAYYLRAELTEPDHPVNELAAARADDDDARRSSLAHLRRIANEHSDSVSMCGYHDITELPSECIDWE